MAPPALQLNPYAGFLGDARPREVLEMTPVTIARLIRDSDTARLTRAPAPGKWSVRDILCHLADCEVVFAFRLRQTIAEAHHRIQPFDQECVDIRVREARRARCTRSLHGISSLEPALHQCRRRWCGIEESAASRARRDDLQNHRGDDGWSRHQPPAPDRKSRLARRRRSRDREPFAHRRARNRCRRRECPQSRARGRARWPARVRNS